MMPSDSIQNVRFDQINERKAGANVIGELNDGPKESRARIGGIFSACNPRSQCRRRYQKIARSFCEAVGGLLFGRFPVDLLFLQSHVTDYALGVCHSQVDVLTQIGSFQRVGARDVSVSSAFLARAPLYPGLVLTECAIGARVGGGTLNPRAGAMDYKHSSYSSNIASP